MTSPPSDVPRNRAQVVQIDVTEPAWVKALDFGEAAVQVASLSAGDLLALCDDGAAVLIERKSAGDLLQSVRDGRLLAQAAGMRVVTPWCYVVVTEPMYPGRRKTVMYEPRVGRTVVETGWSWSALQGVLMSVQELGVGVVFIAGADEFALACTRIFGRTRGDVPVARRDAVPMDDATRILTAVPGVGAERARALLRDCGTAAAALWALTDTPRDGFRKNVIGVGPGTRQAARKALGLEAGWVLRPAREEDE